MSCLGATQAAEVSQSACASRQTRLVLPLCFASGAPMALSGSPPTFDTGWNSAYAVFFSTDAHDRPR